MKNILIKNLVVGFLIILGSAQNVTSQNAFLGTWRVYCVTETTTSNSLVYCDLCPYSMNEDKTIVSFEDFEMVFEEDFLDLIIDESPLRVDYKYDNDSERLYFTFKENKFKFKILHIMDGKTSRLIFRDDTGMLLLLEKEKYNYK